MWGGVGEKNENVWGGVGEISPSAPPAGFQMEYPGEQSAILSL